MIDFQPFFKMNKMSSLANLKDRIDRRPLVIPTIVLTFAVIAWLWPIGFGCAEPVGGDVTNFTIGLMAELSRAFKAGRPPLWNANWGFGFPGLAESQMGVFYPPHWLFYGLPSTEIGYTLSLIAHTLFGAYGAAWGARRWGVSPWGSVFAAIAWSCSGFFIAHIPHQWGYSTASWLPWAWGVCPLVLSGNKKGRAAIALAAILALQTLPGHFQIAFYTQISVLLIGMHDLIERLIADRKLSAGFARIVLAVFACFPLSAIQLIPTYNLARLSSSDRDFTYLAGFAQTPLHLVCYAAPALFHRSPLWRPVVWDPFRTAPEELLSYLGLFPLLFSLRIFIIGIRSDATVRRLAALSIAASILSLGPYVPGFRLLVNLPGFSFFRAQARWGVIADLALAFAAGLGFDSIKSWKKPTRDILAFATILILWIALSLSIVEIMISSSESGSTAIPPSSIRASIFGAAPWSRVASAEAAKGAKTPQLDVRVVTALAREGWDDPPPGGIRFDRVRNLIYRAELAPSALAIALVIASTALVRRSESFKTLVIIITFLDLWFLNRHRGIETAPISRLIDRSPVLAEAARSPEGTRVVAALGNLPIVADVGTIAAYRTLDLPELKPLADLARIPLVSRRNVELVENAMKTAGATIRIIDPVEWNRSIPPAIAQTIVDRSRTIEDPELASWLYGSKWVTRNRAWGSRFVLWRPSIQTAKARLVDDEASIHRIEKSISDKMLLSSKISEKRIGRSDIAAALEAIEVVRRARPLKCASSRPERSTIEFECSEPSIVVVSQIAVPGWTARATSNGTTRPMKVESSLGGMQTIRIPAAGKWTIDLAYDIPELAPAAAISAISWIFLASLYVRLLLTEKQKTFKEQLT